VITYGREVLEVPKRLEGKLHMEKGRNAMYKPVDEAMAYVGAQMVGIVRLNHLDQVLPEAVLADILGMAQWPSENTEQRFLKRATEETLKGINDLMEHLVLKHEVAEGSRTIEVDGDVTGVPQRARKREGVQSGYCGGRARPCYQQPRVTVNGLAVWTDLRRGGDGCTDVFDRTLETGLKLAWKHPECEVEYRVDGFFASRGNLRVAQYHAKHQRNLIFLLSIHASQMKPGRWEELVAGGQGPWKRVNSTTEIRELGEVQPWGEQTQPVRAVAVRREKRGAGGKKRRGPRQWDAQYLIVTNGTRRRRGTRAVFKRYHQRQREEFSFKDGKQSLAMAKMPTAKLMANRMHVRLVAMAQLMLQLFARRFLPHRGRYGPTCKTIREKVIAVGGKNRGRSHARVETDVLRVPLVEALAT
jgi:hypothetical protein